MDIVGEEAGKRKWDFETLMELCRSISIFTERSGGSWNQAMDRWKATPTISGRISLEDGLENDMEWADVMHTNDQTEI